jgi:hypothetical protein
MTVTVLHEMKKVYVKVYSSEGKVSVLQVSGGDCAQEAVVTVVTEVTMVTEVTVVTMVLWMCNPMPFDWIVHVFIYTVVPFS